MKTKVKVSNITKSDMEKIGQLRLRQAKVMYANKPFVTKTWLAIHGGFPMKWLNNNWEEITK